MATLLDANVLSYFAPLFVILFIFVLLYGLLEYIKPFGSNKQGIHSMIALMVAFIFLMSGISTNMVKIMVPWFLVSIIFLFFVILMIRMFNVSESDMTSIIKNTSVYPWIVIFAVIVLLSSLSAVFGQGLLERGSGNVVTGNSTVTAEGSAVVSPDIASSGRTDTSSFSTNMMNTLRNTKVAGMIFIFLVGAFAMFFLTKAASVS